MKNSKDYKTPFTLIDFEVREYKDSEGKEFAEIEAYVLIEREGEKYVVPVRNKMDDPKFSFIQWFLQSARDIQKKWKVNKEPVDTDKGKMLMQIPLKDYLEGKRAFDID